MSGAAKPNLCLTAVVAVSLPLVSALGPVDGSVSMTSPHHVRTHRAALSDDDTASRYQRRAVPVVFSTSQSRFSQYSDNQGWWSTRYSNDAANDNYRVGESEEPGVENRIFFTFDLSGLGGRVESARLVLRRYRGSGEATETLGLFAVATGAVRLNNNTGPNRAIFSDLGSGRSYGRFPVATRSPNHEVRLSLNRAAVADINASRGHFFSIGGSLLSAGGCPLDGNCDSLFRFSTGRGRQQLIAYVREPV